MTRAEAQSLCERLQGLVPEYPGASPEAVREADKIAFRFRSDEDAPAYLGEKLSGVLSSLDIWCSARKWEGYRDPGGS